MTIYLKKQNNSLWWLVQLHTIPRRQVQKNTELYTILAIFLNPLPKLKPFSVAIQYDGCTDILCTFQFG